MKASFGCINIIIFNSCRRAEGHLIFLLSFCFRFEILCTISPSSFPFWPSGDMTAISTVMASLKLFREFPSVLVSLPGASWLWFRFWKITGLVNLKTARFFKYSINIGNSSQTVYRIAFRYWIAVPPFSLDVLLPLNQNGFHGVIFLTISKRRCGKKHVNLRIKKNANCTTRELSETNHLSFYYKWLSLASFTMAEWYRSHTFCSGSRDDGGNSERRKRIEKKDQKRKRSLAFLIKKKRISICEAEPEDWECELRVRLATGKSVFNRL